DAHVDLDNTAEAIDFYNRALAVDVTHADAHFGLGVAYSDQEAYGKAIESFSEAIEYGFEPLAEAYTERGFAYQDQADDVDAIIEFSAALEEDNTFAPAYLGRAIAHFNQGHFEIALTDLNAAIDNEVDDLGQAYAYRAR